jgi:hypothetical protein
VTPLTSNAARRWGVAYLSLFVFWVALVGTRDALELAVGAGAAAVGLVAAVVTLARGGFPTFAFTRRAWSRAASGIARIPRDLLLIARGLRASGSVSTARLPAGTDWRHRAERGFAELAGSLAPNSILYDVSADGTAEQHDLVRRGR